MAKLINLQVMEARSVICVWREDAGDGHTEFRCGIACDDAMAGYMIPRFVIIGTFDDGRVMAAGARGMDFINEYGACSEITEDEDFPDLFMYHEFCYQIDLHIAKAIVRSQIDDGFYDDEESAKAGIYADMKLAGVEISDEAEEYLVKMTDEMCIEKIKALGDRKSDPEAFDKVFWKIVARWTRDNARFKVGDILTDDNSIIRVEKVRGGYCRIPDSEGMYVEYYGQRLTTKLQPYKNGDVACLMEGLDRKLYKINEPPADE